MSNVFAYTAPGGSYPEYISVNETKDGGLSVTVRSPSDFVRCGDTASIDLTADQVAELILALARSRPSPLKPE